jgi:hypothetical protein
MAPREGDIRMEADGPARAIMDKDARTLTTRRDESVGQLPGSRLLGSNVPSAYCLPWAAHPGTVCDRRHNRHPIRPLQAPPAHDGSRAQWQASA